MLFQHWPPPSSCQQVSVWRCSVTADPRSSSCSVWDAATLGASISSTAFTYSSCCHVKWRGRVACLFHTFSISSTVCFTCSAVWEPPNWCTYQLCNWVESVWCDAETVGHTEDSKTPGVEENPDRLPRRRAAYPEIHSVTFSVILVAMSLSPGCFSFLLKVSASVCCFGVFACTLERTHCFTYGVCFLCAASDVKY